MSDNSPLSELDEVAPLVGAWIEIEEPEYERLCNMVAPLVGTWIEILQG